MLSRAGWLENTFYILLYAISSVTSDPALPQLRSIWESKKAVHQAGRIPSRSMCTLVSLSFFPGSEVTFTDAEEYKWHDPALWHAAFSLEDLEQGKYLFSVDEERVPCQHDDVIFQPETSFRVNIDSSEQMIHLQSISIMGQVTQKNWEIKHITPSISEPEK